MQEFQPTPGLAGRLFGGAADQLGPRHGGAALVPEEVRCPRCDSANTKFCYYNNYNLSQPRHFCKACRRYWTKGGLLRNVPVGGGCRRKPKRHASSSSDVGKNGDAHRDAKNPRSGCTGASSTQAASAVSVPNIVGAAAPPPSSNGSTTATGVGPSTFTTDALPLPLPPPAPIFADQAAAFATLFAPRPLPAFSTLTEQPSSAPCNTEMAPFTARSVDSAMTPAADWPPATVIDAGMFDLAGVFSGDTSSYWNTASWTDPDGTTYLP